ncbi:MAG: ATP synthase F1 subunit delta [Alphaproteobacteria bacterium RIFCSPLOWO2_01_FULL_45_8]|nr:MAG: ATP synthase F1 subunit delta [Alphaproteobacteria bacterium GWB1_45_5]OFW76398.1 MAG: ATP synthase F1 subunit delta [Alphaproteobacteria bacterium GWA1_45_9]OFW89327.1 MAG: ATP synthase F1 subunit delta [Alphaproteobacteria bacterium RIFCSPHIGHO2_01_FULL_41_14]OFW95903.1 MAG: ATP synthase F1 subunit delta [Alphaproteobacteria bacterium RIFCSPLOWO2_01_FULL_45_8]HCI48305.1 ATP synthase F1 subunit delta [Holosporales bacterium]
MKTSKNKISRILALAFFESERKEKIRRQYLLALQKIVFMIDQAPKFYSFLVSPMFSIEEKEVFFSISKTPKSVLFFLRLIIENKMISHLKEITNHYEELLYASLGKTKATVTVAHSYDISKSMEELLSKKLEKLIQKKAQFIFEIDPTILGGFQLETSDFYLDSSLKKTLADMRNSL